MDKERKVFVGQGRRLKTESGESDGSMTFQEWVKALPEAERAKFFRQIMEVVDAGRKAGVPPEELAKMYANTYKEVEKNT
jgi:hypothetical protein